MARLSSANSLRICIPSLDVSAEFVAQKSPMVIPHQRRLSCFTRLFGKKLISSFLLIYHFLIANTIILQKSVNSQNYFCKWTHVKVCVLTPTPELILLTNIPELIGLKLLQPCIISYFIPPEPTFYESFTFLHISGPDQGFMSETGMQFLQTLFTKVKYLKFVFC